MKGSLITPAQRGLPSFSPPIAPTFFPPFSTSFTPPIPSFHIHPALCRATFNWDGGAFKDSHKRTQKHTRKRTQKLPERMCMCVRTLNLPKQFFQCNWAWGTCIHEIAQPLLHACCSGVYVPLLALQRRQFPNHILTGVFERLLSTREREGDERQSGPIATRPGKVARYSIKHRHRKKGWPDKRGIKDKFSKKRIKGRKRTDVREKDICGRERQKQFNSLWLTGRVGTNLNLKQK